MLLHIKKVAFPHKHGSWGFFLEPILLALLVGYTYSGILLALSSFIIFLAHQPIRVFFNKKTSRKVQFITLVIFIIYALLIFSILILILAENNYENFIPFFISVLIMFGYLMLELKNFGKSLFVEFIALLAISFIALNIVLLDQWTLTKILLFGIVLLSRVIPTLFYVHTKVEIIKGKQINSLSLRISESIFLVVIVFFAFYNSIPYLSILAIVILILRSIIGLLPKNRNEKVKRLGMKEFGFGTLFVIINAIGYLFGC